MKNFLLALSLLISMGSISRDVLPRLTVQLVDEKGKDVKKEAFIKLSTPSGETILHSMDGKFEINRPDKETDAEVTIVGDKKKYKIRIPGNAYLEAGVADKDDQTFKSPLIVTKSIAVSPDNYWVGAKIAYNVTGDNSGDNFIGSARGKLNITPKWGKKERGQTLIIGNIGKLKFDDSEDDNKNISNLAQSANGIEAGGGFLWTFDNGEVYRRVSALRDNEERVAKRSIRLYIFNTVRYNKFVNVGVDSAQVELVQYKLFSGFEYEFRNFINGGAFTATVEPSLTLFDRNRFKQVTGKDWGAILAVDASVILPVSANLGFCAGGTFVYNSKPIFNIGVVVKSN